MTVSKHAGSILTFVRRNLPCVWQKEVVGKRRVALRGGLWSSQEEGEWQVIGHEARPDGTIHRDGVGGVGSHFVADCGDCGGSGIDVTVSKHAGSILTFVRRNLPYVWQKEVVGKRRVALRGGLRLFHSSALIQGLTQSTIHIARQEVILGHGWLSTAGKPIDFAIYHLVCFQIGVDGVYNSQ